MTISSPSAGKLVRDNVPQIIRSSGAEPIVRTAAAEEYASWLRSKLTEEVREYLGTPDDPAELADILEVLLALAADLGIDPAGLERLRACKAATHGRFTCRYIWHGNTSRNRDRA